MSLLVPGGAERSWSVAAGRSYGCLANRLICTVRVAEAHVSFYL